MKRFLRFIGMALLCCVGATVALAAWRGHRSPLDICNDATVVGIAIGILGALMRAGASTGDGPVKQEMTLSVSSTPKWLLRADGQDMLEGIDFGVKLIVAGVLWIAFVTIAYGLFVQR